MHRKRVDTQNEREHHTKILSHCDVAEMLLDNIKRI